MRFDLKTLRGDIFGGIAMDIQEHETVIFDFSETTVLDDSAALVVEDLAPVAQTETRGCVVAGLSGPAEEALAVFGVREHLPQEHFVSDLETAKKRAWELVNE